MSNEPFVTVIVPVYNGERTIGACIESLLAQDYPKDRYEIIIVDNGSTDGTKKIIESFSCHQSPVASHQNERVTWCRGDLVCVLEEQKRGSYAARNTGVKHAKGKILAFTDADCIADKDWLKNGVAGFLDESVGCVAGAIRAAMPETYVEKYLAGMQMLSQEESGKFFKYLPFAQTANAFFRKEVFDRIGCFEELWVSGGDADFSWRMQRETGYKLSFANDAVILHKHRSTPGGLFRQVMKNGEGNILLFRKYPEIAEHRTLKQSLWTLCRMIRSLFTILFFSFRSGEDLASEARKRYLDNITFFAREIGRLKGMLKNAVSSN